MTFRLPIPQFHSTHVYTGIFTVAGFLAGILVSARGCDGNKYLRACRDQLAVAQSYQGKFRAEMGELIARRFGPDALRNATIYDRNGNIDENETFTAYHHLLEQMVKEPRRKGTNAPDAGVVAVAYGRSSRSAECPVPAQQPCPPRPICEVNTVEVERERAISAGLEDRLTVCTTETEDLRVQLGLVPLARISESTAAPAAVDCSSEYQRGFTAGKTEHKPARSEPVQYKSCADLKGATTPGQLSTVLSVYINAAQRPIQVSVNDPALSRPEAARGVVSEFCGAGEVGNNTLITQVDTLLTSIYGRKMMYPSHLKPGEVVCRKIEGRVVRIGTEYLNR